MRDKITTTLLVGIYYCINQDSGHSFKFSDLTDFKIKLEQAAAKLASCEKIVFILAGDGQPGVLEVPFSKEKKTQLVSLDNFLNAAKDKFAERLLCIQLASCECMKDDILKKQVLEQLQIPCVGYTKQVDWNDSASVDLYFLMMLFEDEGDVAVAYDQVKEMMAGLVRKTGFTVYIPTFNSGKKSKQKR